MPNSLIKKAASTCNIDIAELEKRWSEAEERTINQYGSQNKLNYSLIVGIFKRSLGKDCCAKLGWSTIKKPISESINELILNFSK